MNVKIFPHYMPKFYLINKSFIRVIFLLCTICLSIKANSAYYASNPEDDGIQSECRKNSTGRSDLRLKINEIVTHLKSERNGIINENISSLIEPYFSTLSDGITEANTVAKNSCLSKFNVIKGNADENIDLYRSYTVLERAFSSKLIIIIDIKIDKKSYNSKISEVKSHLNFVTL